MDFPFRCHGCGAENPQPYRDDNRYSWTCACGHKNAGALRNERFEILFDFGALAFLDGYYREAVANIATAFERLLEFFVRTAWSHAGIAPEQGTAAWKQLAKQSERQLGAFYATYLLARGASPEMPGSKWIEFRNDVVHRGLIPDRERTAEYATVMYRVMKQHLVTLCELAPKAVIDRIEEPARQHGAWATENAYNFCFYCFDGLFGVYRFMPSALELEEDPVTVSGVRKEVAEQLSTRLDFLDSLRARKMFLTLRFGRPPDSVKP